MTTTAVERNGEVQAFEISKELDIAAPPDLTFESVLDELGPAAQTPDGAPLPLRIEPRPGGRWYRDLGNNAGHLWGHVQVIKPPTLLELCGPMPMSYPAINHIQYRLKPNGADGTRLRLVHKAMGLIVPEHRDGMPEGWEHALEQIRERAERKARERKTSPR